MNVMWSTVTVLLSRDGSSYEALGNVIEYRYMPSRETAERMVADKGYVRVDDELISDLKEAWEFIVDEEDISTAELLWLARWADGMAQSPQTGAQLQLTNVRPGRYYDLGARRVSEIVATLAGVQLQPGQDYLADEPAGIVQVLPGGTVGLGDVIDVTFDATAATHQASTSPAVRCKVHAWIIEWDPDDPVPIRQLRCPAVLTAEPLDGQMRQWRVQLTALDRPRVEMRRPEPYDACSHPLSIIGGSDTFQCYDMGKPEIMASGAGWGGPWSFMGGGYFGAAEGWESYTPGEYGSGQLAGGTGWSGPWIFVNP